MSGPFDRPRQFCPLTDDKMNCLGGLCSMNSYLLSSNLTSIFNRSWDITPSLHIIPHLSFRWNWKKTAGTRWTWFGVRVTRTLDPTIKLNLRYSAPYDHYGRPSQRDRRANSIAIAWRCSSVCPFVCPSGTGVHCDHTVYFSADLSLSLWLDSPKFWAPWHQSMSTYSQLCFSTWKRGGILTANRKSYMPRRLTQQGMNLSDLEWPQKMKQLTTWWYC